jgi:hypothetical protein
VIAVIFEVWPNAGSAETYLEIAAKLRVELETIEDFVR